MNCSTPGIPVLHHLPESAQTHVHLVSDTIQQSHPLLSTSPDFSSWYPLSQHQGLCKWVSSLHQVAKVLELQLQHWALQWIFRVDFRKDWPVWSPSVQGTRKSLLQRHSSKTSILWLSAFFMVHLSHPYMTSGKVIALTIWTFIDKVMSWLFNTLSRFIVAFLPRSRGLLISCLQSQSAVILEPEKIKSVTVSIVSPSICHEMMGLDAMNSFECWGISQLFHPHQEALQRLFAFCH